VDLCQVTPQGALTLDAIPHGLHQETFRSLCLKETSRSYSSPCPSPPDSLCIYPFLSEIMWRSLPPQSQLVLEKIAAKP
jgi:hypothetical protein